MFCPPGDNARAQDTSTEDAKVVRRTNGTKLEAEEEEEEEVEDARKEKKQDVELDKGLRVAGEEVTMNSLQNRQIMKNQNPFH